MKKKFFSLFLIFISVFLSSCSKSNIIQELTDNLYRVKINGKWGFINYDGEITIPCIYTSATEFENGISRVSVEKNVFFINKNNEKVKNSNKLVKVDYNEENIDSSLPDAVPDGFLIARKNPCIGEEMYIVMKQDDEDLVGVIGKSGNFILEPKVYGVGNFKNGMAPFQYGHNGIDGYIRKDGIIFDYTNNYSSSSLFDENGNILSENSTKYLDGYFENDLFKTDLYKMEETQVYISYKNIEGNSNLKRKGIIYLKKSNDIVPLLFFDGYSIKNSEGEQFSFPIEKQVFYGWKLEVLNNSSIYFYLFTDDGHHTTDPIRFKWNQDYKRFDLKKINYSDL